MQPDGLPSPAPTLAELALRVAELERKLADLTHSPAPVQVLRRQPPPPPIFSAPSVETPAPPRQSLESRLGSQIFNLVGIVAIIVGTSWFLKLAIERGWIGPAARVLIGILAGVGFVLWSERFRRKGFAAFSYSLKALGSAVLYLSLWASFQLYHQLPAPVALGAMILVTAWNGFMAWSQDAELLAAYGLIGGFATPLLLSTGGNHETFLFTYVAALDLAVVLLQRVKPWRRLLIPAFAGTVAYFIGWYAQFFLRGFINTWTSQSTETSAFLFIFFALFALVSTRAWERETKPDSTLVHVLLPLANAAFVSLALYSVFQDSGLHTSLAWLMVFLAAVYLGLMRLQATALAAAMHLAAAVIFLTIAIPLKASGHTLTTAWLVEGVVLYWASTRFETHTGAPSRVLSWLSGAGYALGLVSLGWHWLWLQPAHDFFNADLGASVVAVAALAGAAWLAQLPAASDGKLARDPANLRNALIAADLVALLLTLREIAVSQFGAKDHPAFANVDFATALVGLAVLAAAAWAAYRFRTRLPVAESLAGATIILFNLATILTVEREISALWTRTDANLQRSLAISAFLMAYGAALLAAGFWRRNAFVRWQALVLLIFTIAKVFLYDISGLSQGYRVASFLALGALLLAVSFAYQKDWLALKTSAPESLPAPPPAPQASA